MHHIGNHGKFLVWVVGTCCKNVSSNSGRNWNMQQYDGKAFKSSATRGHWYPIVSIYFHEHVMTGMMVLRICLGFWTFQYEETFPRDGSPEGLCSREGDVSETWKVCDCTERGWPNCLRDYVAYKGRTGNKFILVISITKCNQKHIGSVEQWFGNCSLRGKIAQGS